MTESTDGERGTGSPAAARHLAELETRYEMHLAALRKNAAELQAAAKRDADALADPATRAATELPSDP